MIIYWVRAERGTVTVKRRHQDEHGSSGGGDRLRRCGGERSLIRKESQAALVKRLGFLPDKAHSPRKPQSQMWVLMVQWRFSVDVHSRTGFHFVTLYDSEGSDGQHPKTEPPCWRPENRQQPQTRETRFNLPQPQGERQPWELWSKQTFWQWKKGVGFEKKKKKEVLLRQREPHPQQREQIRSTENNRSWPSLSTAHRWRAPRAEVPGMCLDTDSCTPPISVDAQESLEVQRQALHPPHHTSLLRVGSSPLSLLTHLGETKQKH